MPYREISGNLFASNAQALVNTVNCVGAMGKGVALEFRRRFPDMFKAYKEVCDQHTLKPGMILPYRTSEPWVLSFAVKDDWKHPSKIDWVEQCLKRFCEWYPEVRLKSVAFPWMGAMNGGIPIEDIQKLTRRYLGDLDDINVEIYSLDPKAPDPLFITLSRLVATGTIEDFIKRSGLQRKQAQRVYTLVGAENALSLMDIVNDGALGKTSLDKLYRFLISPQETSNTDNPFTNTPRQLDLFGSTSCR